MFKYSLKSGYWLATNRAVSWNEKLWCGNLFQEKKDKTKNSLGLHFKAYNQKDMFSALGKMNLFR